MTERTEGHEQEHRCGRLVFPSENAKAPLWAKNEWYDKIPTLDPLDLA